MLFERGLYCANRRQMIEKQGLESLYSRLKDESGRSKGMAVTGLKMTYETKM